MPMLSLWIYWDGLGQGTVSLVRLRNPLTYKKFIGPF